MSQPRYRTTPDRAGWALATGVLAGAGGGGLVGWGGGAATATVLAEALAAGALAGVAIVAIAVPIWWLLGRRGRRGPVAAGLTGALVAALLVLAALTQGFGAELPVTDAATLTAVWTSAAAMAAVAAFLGGLTALAMWLVGYRAD